MSTKKKHPIRYNGSMWVKIMKIGCVLQRNFWLLRSRETG